jgi:predicted amidohydrolase YtcJ
MMTGGFSLQGRRGFLEEGGPADLVVLDGGYAGRWTKDPRTSLFTRVGSRGITRIISRW